MRDHEVVVSDHILAEVREHYIGKFKATPAQADLVIETIRSQCRHVTPASISSDAFGDPDDLPVLGTAVAAGAEVLVTGDQALLGLRTFHQVLVVSPREFYNRLTQK